MLLISFNNISTRNTKTTASAVSFSAILSCEILDFRQYLSVCVRARQLNSYLASYQSALRL